MPRLPQIIALSLALLGARQAGAFSLQGSSTSEAWQTPALGYNPIGNDVGTPKNLGEEYRWNLPVITYGFDSSFINYFGTNGVAAIDAAFAILNSLPDLSSISQSLDEYPILDPATGASTTFRDSRRVNLRAEALNLVDLKSLALGLITEQIGLANASRWTFALRDRKTETNPDTTNYLVIQRNFDPVTYAPSKYVNGTRYTYDVLEFDAPAFTDAVERAVDPEHRLHSFSSVASMVNGLTDTGLGPGVFYTYLTQDDIGGLRYIYDTNNVNWESFAAGTEMIAADYSLLTVITNVDLGTFSNQSLTNSPTQLLALYPGLVITSTNTFPTTIVEVASIVLTNRTGRPWEPVLNTNLFLATNLVTNAAIGYRYTYGNVITNYFSPTSVVRRESSGFDPWSAALNPTAGFSARETSENRVSGGIVILATGSRNIGITNLPLFEFSGLGVTNVIAITNVLFITNVVDTATGLLRTVFDQEITYFTNVQYYGYPVTSQAAPPSMLRPGVGKLNFQRIPGIFTGAGFQYTNVYQAAYYTNNGLSTNVFVTVQTQPDLMFRAADLGVFDDSVFPVQVRRGPEAAFVNNAAINSSEGAQGGPGNIFGPVTIDFNKLGPSFFNSFPGFTTEASSLQTVFFQPFIWGWFDGSTNAPVVFPKDISLEQVDLLITGGSVP